jgi:hypothetical protein
MSHRHKLLDPIYILTEDFRGFPQSFQANSGMVSLSDIGLEGEKNHENPQSEQPVSETRLNRVLPNPSAGHYRYAAQLGVTPKMVARSLTKMLVISV